MAVTIDYDKLQSGNRITWTWTPAGGITDVEDALISELNAGYNISSAVAFDGTDFSNQASETNNEPSFADEGNVQTRGASQYGGSVSMWYPKNFHDSTNPLSVAYDLLKTPRTPGFLSMRIDGDTKTTEAYDAGQYVSTYQVLTDGETNELGGSEGQRRTVTALSRGNLAVYTVTRSGAAALVVPATATPAPSEKGRFEATLNGRYFGGVEWSTSDPDVIQVWPGGFYTVTGADTDTATITVRHKGLSDTIAVTVTATP